ELAGGRVVEERHAGRPVLLTFHLFLVEFGALYVPIELRAVLVVRKTVPAADADPAVQLRNIGVRLITVVAVAGKERLAFLVDELAIAVHFEFASLYVLHKRFGLNALEDTDPAIAVDVIEEDVVEESIGLDVAVLPLADDERPLQIRRVAHL